MTMRRNDEDWLRDLAADDAALREAAVGDLRDLLIRGLSKTMSKYGRVDDAFLEDVAQEASLRVLAKLDTYAGRSKFVTWAVTIAVRVALSQMRKREWQNVSLDGLTADAELDPNVAVDEAENVEQRSHRTELLSKLKELIDSELTERQWTAITAELRGMPLAQVADKLGSNPNSLYKLLHDARKKLRRGLEEAGYTNDDIRETLA